jgi:hypothetical protein
MQLARQGEVDKVSIGLELELGIQPPPRAYVDRGSASDYSPVEKKRSAYGHGMIESDSWRS